MSFKVTGPRLLWYSVTFMLLLLLFSHVMTISFGDQFGAFVDYMRSFYYLFGLLLGKSKRVWLRIPTNQTMHAISWSNINRTEVSAVLWISMPYQLCKIFAISVSKCTKKTKIKISDYRYWLQYRPIRFEMVSLGVGNRLFSWLCTAWVPNKIQSHSISTLNRHIYICIDM